MTYYELLNVKQTATDKEIKIAYRALAKKYHPDTYVGNKHIAEEKMKQLNEAYDVLSNKESREKYDQQFVKPKTSTVYQQPESTTTTKTSSYYGSYKAPDPPQADYRGYYNYSPYYEESDLEYDFSKLKELFQGSNLKVTFVVMGILSLFVFLGSMLNRLKIETTALLEAMSAPTQVQTQIQPVKEVIPQHNYMSETPQIEELEEVPDNEYTAETVENNNNSLATNEELKVEVEAFEKALEEQFKEIEKEYNEWYESEGKEYEEKLKKELNSLYEELKKQANINN